MKIPIVFIRIALFISFVLSFAIVAYSNVLMCFCLIPFAFIYSIRSVKNPRFFFGGLLLLIPVIGFINVLLKIKGIDILLPLLFGGLFGLSFYLFPRIKSIFLTRLEILLLIITSFSLCVSFMSYGRSVFHPHSIVAQLPWGEIKVGNAIAWSLLSFLSFLGAFILYIFSKSFFRGEIFYLASRCYAYGIIICLFFLVGEYLGLIRFESFLDINFPGRYSGTFLDPNAMGTITGSTLPIWAGYAIGFCSKRVLYMGPVLLLIAMMSGSRSALIIIGVGTFIWGFLYWKNSMKDTFRVIFLLIISGLIFWLVIGRIQKENFRYQAFLKDSVTSIRSSIVVKNDLKEEIDSPGIMKNILGDRVDLWKAGWVTFKNNPLFGTGIGTYLIKMPGYRDKIGKIVNDNPANQYLLILAEQGVIGFVVFMLFIGSILLSTLKRILSKKEPLLVGVFGGFIGLLVALNFGAHLVSFETNILFWLYLAYLSPENQLQS